MGSVGIGRVEVGRSSEQARIQTTSVVFEVVTPK